MKYLCTECSQEQQAVEFDMRADWMAHMKLHKEGKVILPLKIEPGEESVALPTTPETTPTAPVVTKKPIELTYKFVGQCELCGREVDTVDVEVEGKMFMMAYCPPCKKRCAFILVIPIDKQYETVKEKSTGTKTN